jgi:ring-1,2-phenylacetyl-CoA epoxidase subunit PaaE
MAKVTNGQVKMDVCYALDEDEVARGYILTCQAHPVSEDVEISYDI